MKGKVWSAEADDISVREPNSKKNLESIGITKEIKVEKDIRPSEA